MIQAPEHIDTIRKGDCIKLMSEMPGECVNLIITNPPLPSSSRGAKRSRLISEESRRKPLLLFGSSIPKTRRRCGRVHCYRILNAA